jgi:hypothetical protein
MTSLPSRVSLLRPTIESLRSGDLQPDRIILALPERSTREQCGYAVPPWLDELEVEVVRPAVDYGPGTKLLGVLPSLTEACYLVLADDDVRYSPTFLKGLIEAQRDDHSASFSYYVYRSFGLSIGQGCDGFSFWTPNLAGIEQFADEHALNTPLRLHDDLWISYFLASRGIRIGSLQHSLNGNLVYEQLHELNALRYLEGDDDRATLSRKGLRALLSSAPLPAGRQSRVRACLLLDDAKRLLKAMKARAAGPAGARD